MKLVRFMAGRLGPRVGLLKGGTVIDLTSIEPASFSSLLEVFRRSQREGMRVADFVDQALGGFDRTTYTYQDLDRPGVGSEPHLVIPHVPPEVWGCGITYVRMRQVKEGETGSLGLYDRVYEAERPEIFFKATGDRCVGPNEAICVRSDSKSTVPESELAFITGWNGEILGYTVGNDVTARDIEAENPLYLPQAKIYKGCCAIGPAIATLDSIGDPMALGVDCTVYRGGEVAFQGKSSTARMRRSLDELLKYLSRDNPVPPGTVCLTGTGIAPPSDFTLAEGDLVEITIEKVGTLRNFVKKL